MKVKHQGLGTTMLGWFGKVSARARNISRTQTAAPVGRSRSSVRRPLTILVTLTAFGAEVVVAQQPRPADLGDLSLEQLVDLPLVSVVSKRPQKAQEAPALVDVVPGEEIRRHGYRTLADVLRTLPGFYVSYDRNYSYVGVRGFGRPGDYNTRILLLVDGVRMNDNVYDGAYVGQEMPVDTGVIDRIEVSRGPSAAMYGNNAFFAVVNVVTKRGRELGGGELRAGRSSFSTYEGFGNYGRTLAGGADFVVSGSLLSSGGQQLFFPEFAETDDGIVQHGDGERAVKAFGSFAKGGLFLEALHSVRTKHIPTASYGTLFGDTRALTRDAFTTASARYDRSLGARFDWSSRLTFVSYDYDGTYPFELATAGVSLYDDHGRGRWWTAESMGVLRAGPQTLTLGGEFIRNARQDQGAAYDGLPESGFEIPDHGLRYGAFVQDDIALGGRLRLSLGARYDHHEDFGGQANPRVALILTPEKRTTIKLLYGSAYRAPNEYEQNYYTAQRQAARELRPETIRTLEAAVEQRLGDKVHWSASVFSNHIRDLITLESDVADRLLFQNTGSAVSRGGEASLDVRFHSGAGGRLSYSYQQTRDGDERPLSNSPSHMLKANFTTPVLGQAAWASLDAQYLSSRRTLSGAQSAAFVLVNATLLTRRLPGGVEASASVYNVFDARYADPGSEEHRQDAIVQDGRSFALKLGWRF